MHRSFIATPLSLVAASLLASTALAQAPAAAPAVPPIAAPTAPAIPGICVFSYDRVIADSMVGQAYLARLQQLNGQVQAELTADRTPLETEARALEGQRATLAPEAFAQRAAQVNERIQAYGDKEELRARELEATRGVQLQRIVQEVNPLVAQVYNTRSCSIVFDSQALIATNTAMDITDDVIAQLNTRMNTITFDRERLDQQAAAPAAPAR